MNVIGLKKCLRCGHKELYGCHNNYTIGAPFICPNCSAVMDYASFQYTPDYVTDEEYQKTWDFLKANLATLDFITKTDGDGCLTVNWIGLPKTGGGQT